MARFVFVIFTAFAALASACYEAPTPACAFSCGPDGACPDGYRCAGDGWCKRADVAEDFACGTASSQPDAATPDAAGADAAMPDAAPDDAMPTDAMAPDAALPDAAPDANQGTLR